jgi:hypothetical protein
MLVKTRGSRRRGPTDRQALEIILKRLRGRYHGRLMRAEIRHGLCLTATQDSVLHEDGSVYRVAGWTRHAMDGRDGIDRDAFYEIDVAAETGTCPDLIRAGGPCLHWFAAVIYSQMQAVKQARYGDRRCRRGDDRPAVGQHELCREHLAELRSLLAA